jgi:hypothetical protein
MEIQGSVPVSNASTGILSFLEGGGPFLNKKTILVMILSVFKLPKKRIPSCQEQAMALLRCTSMGPTPFLKPIERGSLNGL